jgi:uncharacterized phage-associated protein
VAYDPRKAAQTIAYLTVKNGRTPLNILKAVKLVYLADRESLRRHGFPIQDEPHYSLPHGPVNSTTYEFMKGEVRPDRAAGWSEFLTDRSNHRIGLKEPNIDPDNLDELSDADVEVLDAIWDQFGHVDQWELVDWTHDPHNIPEWEDPQGSSQPIPLRRIMEALGIENAVEQEKAVQDSRRASAFLSAL